MSLVERLREPDRTYTSDRSGLCVEAADEIERLRAHLKALEAAAHQAIGALEECNKVLPVLATALQNWRDVLRELRPSFTADLIAAHTCSRVAAAISSASAAPAALVAALRGTGGNE